MFGSDPKLAKVIFNSFKDGQGRILAPMGGGAIKGCHIEKRSYRVKNLFANTMFSKRFMSAGWNFNRFSDLMKHFLFENREVLKGGHK